MKRNKNKLANDKLPPHEITSLVMALFARVECAPVDLLAGFSLGLVMAMEKYYGHISKDEEQFYRIVDNFLSSIRESTTYRNKK